MKHRKGLSYGNERLIDGVVVDYFQGLNVTDPLGLIAEEIALQEQISK